MAKDAGPPAERATTTAQQGSFYTVVASERKSMMFMISELEMRSISVYNGLIAACLSIASALVAFGGGLAVQTAQQENAPDTAWTLVKVVGIGCGVLALILVGAAVMLWKVRDGAIDTIKKETRPL
jgi:hypothetical protein